MSVNKICLFCSEEIKATAIKCKQCGSMLGGNTPLLQTTGNTGTGGGATLLPGTVVGQYEIVGVLGQGGMGVVYESVHQYTQQRVALKAVWPNLMMDETARKRFLEEGRMSNGRRLWPIWVALVAVVAVLALVWLSNRVGPGDGAAEVEAEEAKRMQAEAQRGDMVRIPAGTFWMGCNEAVDSECEDEEKPYHEVYVDEFWMDRHEVTVGEYAQCVGVGKCSKPKTKSDSENYNWGYWDRDNHPINGVNWRQAAAYCQWAGHRLPTEAEWEKAARGTDGRKYPWGNEKATCQRAVMDEGGCGCGKMRTWPVCSKSSGNSPYGLCDMAGNVFEWVQDWYAINFYKKSGARNPRNANREWGRVLRGGGWDCKFRRLRASDRDGSKPGSSFYWNGFRCASGSR